MLFNILTTILFLPVYLALRWPYFKLPMGADVGYYVSNDTIVNRKFTFCKGWNARYALCSKFIPELFCSSAYVKFGHKKYNFSWRFAFSFYNYVTAISVGCLAYVVSSGAPFAYVAGFISYCLISSEPHYGIYYESAEQFEVLFQTLGTFFIFLGLFPLNKILVLTGTGLWFIDVFFVKLTAVTALAPLAIGLVFFEPSIIPLIAVEATFFSLAYIVLFIKCNKNPFAAIRTEVSHQLLYSRGADRNVRVIHGLLLQLETKIRQLQLILGDNPYVPLFAFIGIVVLPGNIERSYLVLLCLYFSGTIIKLCISFVPIWWYSIPLLPVISLFSAFGICELLGIGLYGMIIIAVILFGWSYVNGFKIFKMEDEKLNSFAWKRHREMGQLHYNLQNIAEELEKIIGNDSLFVYGLPSPCAMVGQSYNVNFLTAVFYLEDMNPHWQEELHMKMVENPPAYIYDMVGKFDFEAVYDNLGLKYEAIQTWNISYGKQFLYKLIDCKQIDNQNVRFKSLKDNEMGYRTKILKAN